MELNYESIPKLRGNDAKTRFNKINKLVERSRWPVFLVGPSGSGKTIMAMNVAKYYSKKHNVPAYYVQLSPDQTKTSLILGLRLENGSLVPKRGIVAQAMEEGAIVVVDEAPHASQELLLMFNSICDRTSVTAIGDDAVLAEDTFRVIFCGNTSSYAANQKLPQSFAQRLIAFNFDYPSFEDEASIAYKMYQDEFDENVTVPNAVCKYITSIVRNARTERFPLSVRNIAATLMLLDCESDRTEANSDEVEAVLEELAGANAESLLSKAYTNIYNKQSFNAEKIREDEEVYKFFSYVAAVGVNNFVNAVLSSTCYYLDIEGFDFDTDEIKDKLRASIF